MDNYNDQIKDLFEVFTSAREVDEEIFINILNFFRKEHITDSIEYLSIEENKKFLQSYIIKLQNSSKADDYVYKLEALES